MTRQGRMYNTILAQLGGNRFIAMTGAKNIVGSPTALSLRFGPGGKAGVNGLRVELNANDYYDVSFYKLRVGALQVIEKIDNVPAENLREVFTRVTGLETSLGTMGNPTGRFSVVLREQLRRGQGGTFDGFDPRYWEVTRPDGSTKGYALASHDTEADALKWARYDWRV